MTSAVAITNSILAIDEQEEAAECRSCYTDLQIRSGLPLQVIAADLHRDRIVRLNGARQFAYRVYSPFDHQVDLSQYLRR